MLLSLDPSSFSHHFVVRHYVEDREKQQYVYSEIDGLQKPSPPLCAGAASSDMLFALICYSQTDFPLPLPLVIVSIHGRSN